MDGLVGGDFVLGEMMHRRGVAALLFHHVGSPLPGTHPSLTVEPKCFERFIRLLQRLGYTGISAAAWHAGRDGRASLPGRFILLTFDDGYADLGDFALPILHRLGWGSTVFVATSTVGGRSAWDEPEAVAHRIMSADDIRAWAARGVEFGAHGATHCDLTRVDSKRLWQEVVGGRDALAELLGGAVTAFAYPYGSYDDDVRELVASSFDLAFGLDEGLNDGATDRTRLRRTMVQHSDTTMDLALRARLGWSPLERVRGRARVRDRAWRLNDLATRRAARRTPSRSAPPFRRR
jgi:peptidoglycan/xylan/chitin deacetylase (PgdA/CDA1 family)